MGAFGWQLLDKWIALPLRSKEDVTGNGQGLDAHGLQGACKVLKTE